MNQTVRLDLARILPAALIVLAILVGGYGFKAYSEGLAPFAPSEDTWHGVFLTNGQAYFGHYYAGPGETGVLRDVFYVLATQLQPQNPAEAAGQGETQLTLQRLGGEIHGPRNEMHIYKDQILFVEELRADSQLVAAILELKRNPNATPAPATRTQAPATTASPTASPTRSP